MPKIALSIHRYAPEMNRAYVLHRRQLLAELKCPGLTTVAQVRAKLFAKVTPGIVAILEKSYPEPWKSLSETRIGRVETRAAAVGFARDLRRTNAGGILENGKVLPAPTITVKTKLIG